MPLIPFPSIPDLPGVPAIPRSVKFPPVATAALGLLQGMLWRIAQVQTRWGIFDSQGKPLGDPKQFVGIIGRALESAGVYGAGPTLSTGSVDYSKETKVSDFPIERGGFASYNKVESPANPQVVLCLQGSEADRRSFLDAVDTACKSTDLFSVVTPELTYINYSIERYNYARRNSKGATLLIVEITLKEVRQISAQYSQVGEDQIDTPQDVGATPQVSNGKVQGKIPVISTLKSIANKLPGLADRAESYIQGLVF